MLWSLVVILFKYKLVIIQFYAEAATRGVLWKNLFYENISQNSQENTCSKVSFLTKLHASTSNFIKKETLAQVFSCFLQNTSGWLLLFVNDIHYQSHYLRYLLTSSDILRCVTWTKFQMNASLPSCLCLSDCLFLKNSLRLERYTSVNTLK